MPAPLYVRPKHRPFFHNTPTRLKKPAACGCGPCRETATHRSTKNITSCIGQGSACHSNQTMERHGDQWAWFMRERVRGEVMEAQWWRQVGWEGRGAILGVELFGVAQQTVRAPGLCLRDQFGSIVLRTALRGTYRPSVAVTHQNASPTASGYHTKFVG
uniref:Uncharacterized protein n=1 Tax=Eutreptiella gymnastica TaxID=73025 RepID=A0A7S4LGU1_9EUGL